MKRLMLVFLTVLILASTLVIPANAADVTTETYDCTLLKAMGYDAKKWTSSADNRAMFTILAVLEYTVASGTDISSQWSIANVSFVLRIGLEVGTLLRMNDGSWMMIYYNPTQNPDHFKVGRIPNNASTSAVRSYLQESCDYYWENDAVDLYNAVSLLQSLINGN